ncbi:MAG: hypothetical protein ACK5NC_11460 [Vibrio sp.]
MKATSQSEIKSPPKRISDEDKAKAETRKRIEDFELAKELELDLEELWT